MVGDKLYQWVRVEAGREASPSEAAVDSQSVETATMIYQEVGYDSGKKIHGRKRHLTVDLLGRGISWRRLYALGNGYVSLDC